MRRLMNGGVRAKVATALAVGVFVALPGCQEDGAGTDAGQDASGEVADLGKYEGGCEHMAEGPGQPVVGVAFDDPAAPGLAAEHTRFDVTLPEVAGGQGGDVAYPSAEATDYVIALDVDVPLEVLDGSGVAVDIEASVRTGLPCAGVAVFHTVELDVGTYTLRFGPSSTARVSVVIEKVGGHVHAVD